MTFQSAEQYICPGQLSIAQLFRNQIFFLKNHTLYYEQIDRMTMPLWTCRSVNKNDHNFTDSKVLVELSEHHHNILLLMT